MSYQIAFAPETGDQLEALYEYVAVVASANTAMRFSEAIVTFCESLRMFPYRGTLRDDLRPGLRITNYKRRAVVAFTVNAELVSIIGVFYGGQDYEAILLDDADQKPVMSD